MKFFKGYDFKSLNSATKYPSIETYHKLGAKGVLQPEVNVDFSDCDNISISEKIDGTNSRIVLFPDGDYLIGSREEMLYAKGDRVETPTLSIVETLKPIADSLCKVFEPDTVKVFYFETFGGNITKASKQYTGDKSVSCRLFDICSVDSGIVNKTPEEISRWRESGGQHYSTTEDVCDVIQAINQVLDVEIEQVPSLGGVVSLPANIGETRGFLIDSLAMSKVDLGGGGGKPEGIVVRSNDRSKIAKIRYDDYNRWLRFQK